MPDNEKDVKQGVDSSEPQDIAVNEPVEATTDPATVETNIENETADPKPAKSVDTEVDEHGVPYKNRAAEWQRKYSELADNLPKMIQEQFKQVSQPQERQYSIAELENFAQENPQHRAWVEEKKEEIRLQKLEATITQKFQAERQQESFIREKQATEAWVTERYPDMFVKDSSNRVVGWNQNNPMTKLISQYMSDPAMASRPDALKIASKLAYADLAEQNLPKAASKVKDLKSQVKRIQQKTMVEGGTKPAPPASDPFKSTLDRLKSSGTKTDAQRAVSEIFLKSGLLKG